jgi:hypothetical protein
MYTKKELPKELMEKIADLLEDEPPSLAAFALAWRLMELLEVLPPEFREATIKLLTNPPRNH